MIERQPLSETVQQFINNELFAPLQWSNLNEVMAHWLSRHQSEWHAQTDILPCLACHAAGGSVESAIPVAGFWLLYFFASKIFDSVQDDDEHDQRWMADGVDDAISYGLAVMMAGNASLAHLTNTNVQSIILRGFSRTWAFAAKSQTESQSILALDNYFKNIIASTGQIFATATWAGGRVATDDQETLQALRQYGLYTGIRLAILSDCRGLAGKTDKPSDVAVGIYKLPVIYAASLENHPNHRELRSLLTGKRLDNAKTERVLSILSEMQAGAWSANIAQQYQQRAIDALASLPQQAIEPLIAYVS